MKRIAYRLGVSVSSVSLWVRDIELSAEQRAVLRNKMSGAWSANAVAARRRRVRSQAAGRELARRNDHLFIAGCMLFWAEGAKSRNAVRIANSDPALLRLVVRFLRECYGAPIERLAITCHLFADHIERQHEIEQFWLDALELPRDCLRPSIVNVYSKYSQKKRRNKLPFGTCKLVYNDTRTVQSIYGAIQEYAGIDRPEWLD
jgi:hypothetical protein